MGVNASMKLNKVQQYVILAVTLGNVLEWYDFYLFIFLANTLSTLFFSQNSTFSGLFGVIGLFAIGFIFRFLGGIYFGRLGDREGRRKAFIRSLTFMAGSTFCMGFIPTYSQAGFLAPIILAILRIAQTFPSGGELPGVFCYLYEAGSSNKKFMSSIAGIGNQIGAAIAALECYFFVIKSSEEFLLNWGWRIEFIIGGLFGFLCLFLRYKLHETQSFFDDVIAHHRMLRSSTWTVFQENWKKILQGSFFGTAQTVSFHFISILFPIYFFRLSGLSNSQSLIATLIILATTAIPLPLYGLLAEKYDVKYLAIGSCLFMLGLLYPLHNAMQFSTPGYAILVMVLFGICLACLTALWPYFLSHLFPTRMRYTCVSLSFNIGDGIFGGLSTLSSLYFINAEKNFDTFIWIAFIGCIVSIFSCLKINPAKG